MTFQLVRPLRRLYLLPVLLCMSLFPALPGPKHRLRKWSGQQHYNPRDWAGGRRGCSNDRGSKAKCSIPMFSVMIS